MNKVDYSDVRVPKYWGLSLSHTSDIKKIVKKYYQELRSFYSEEFITSLLSEIKIRGTKLLHLVNETPYFTSPLDVKKYATFDKRTSSMLFEHYFLLVLTEYIKLTDVDSIFPVEEIKKETQEDIFTVESVEEREQYENIVPDVFSNEEIIEGNRNHFKRVTAKLLVSYFLIMGEHKDLVDDSYDYIMDKVFKLREKEKDNVTDRKKKMTDEERNVDTIMQINKLGLWGKGLEKGLTMYQKEVYDEEREQAEEFDTLERQLKKKNKNVTDRNIDQYMEDEREQLESDAAIDREEFSMAHMSENYWNGNPYGDEPDEDDQYDD